MSEHKSNSIEASKWDWKAGGSAPVVPPKKPINFRLKAVIQASVMTSVGLVFWNWTTIALKLGFVTPEKVQANFDKWSQHIVGPHIIWTLAAYVLLTALFVPPAFHAFERFFIVHFAKWVGTALTWVLMVPVYLLVFTPAHLILKLRGQDPLARKFPTDLPTYWIPRKPVTVEQYKRQH